VVEFNSGQGEKEGSSVASFGGCLRQGGAASGNRCREELAEGSV